MAKKPNARKRFASPRAEFLSAAFMSFWMNTIGVELALVRPFLENTLGFENVDAQGLFLALLFTHLCFFFGPFYGKHSRGALNNPAVYFLFYLTGDADGVTASKGALSAVFGTIVGTFAYEKASRVVVPRIITTGFSSAIAPAVAAGGSVRGAASEATVAFLNFAFAGVAPKLVGDSMAPYAGAFFYVVTVVIEKCRYSCGFMNPAVVLATHVVGGGGKRVFARRRETRPHVRHRRRTGRARGCGGEGRRRREGPRFETRETRHLGEDEDEEEGVRHARARRGADAEAKGGVNVVSTVFFLVSEVKIKPILIRAFRNMLSHSASARVRSPGPAASSAARAPVAEAEPRDDGGGPRARVLAARPRAEPRIAPRRIARSGRARGREPSLRASGFRAGRLPAKRKHGTHARTCRDLGHALARVLRDRRGGQRGGGRVDSSIGGGGGCVSRKKCRRRRRRARSV